MARPRKPTKLKVLEGNRGHRKIEPDPRPAPATPRAPMGMNPQAKKFWKRVAPIVSRLGLLTEVDIEAFTNLCEIQARLVWIRERLSNVDDLVSEGKRGETQAALAVAEKQYFQTFRMYAAEFGLTPRGRTGLGVGSPKDDDDDDLLS